MYLSIYLFMTLSIYLFINLSFYLYSLFIYLSFCLSSFLFMIICLQNPSPKWLRKAWLLLDLATLMQPHYWEIPQAPINRGLQPWIRKISLCQPSLINCIWAKIIPNHVVKRCKNNIGSASNQYIICLKQVTNKIMNHQSIDLFLAANVQRSQLLGKESSAASAEWAPVATQGLGCLQPTWDQWIRLETLQETLGFTMKYRCFFGKKNAIH